MTQPEGGRTDANLRAAAPPLRPAAVVHGLGGLPADALLEDFVAEVARRGFSVGGVVQRNVGSVDECDHTMLLVDVASGATYDITQRLGAGSDACRVNPAEVAAAGSAVRDGLARGVDLIVVNKFAGLEAAGEGLSDELLTAMAAGIPVLTAVSGRFLNEWHAFTGGMADLLSPDPAALWRWWGPHRLYRDLVNGVADAEIRQIVIGEKWIAVETDAALGLTARPAATLGAALPDLKALAKRGLAALAAGAAESWEPLAAALGLAAVNAHYNRADLTGDGGNGLDLFVEFDDDAPPVVIGAFPGLKTRRPTVQVVDYAPGPGQYPDGAADWLLPAAGSALITASSLANRTLPRLLTAAHGRPAALIGPGAPLTDRLFVYGLSALAGFIAEDRAAVLRVIAAGGASRDFHPYGRFVTLRAAES